MTLLLPKVELLPNYNFRRTAFQFSCVLLIKPATTNISALVCTLQPFADSWKNSIHFFNLQTERINFKVRHETLRHPSKYLPVFGILICNVSASYILLFLGIPIPNLFIHIHKLYKKLSCTNSHLS